MPIFEMQDDVELIQKLGDNPNTDNELSAQQLKELFDRAPGLLKAFINGTLVPEVNRLGSDAHMEQVANAAMRGLIEQNIPITVDLAGAEPIAPNVDVDDLTKPGRYACETDEIAKTLLGCDVGKAFTLDVRYANGKGPYVGQELHPRDGSARLYRQFVKYNEILNADAKALYERMQKVKPKQYEYGENYDIYDGTVDDTWYADGKTEYVLEKGSQLYGLAKLVKDGTTKFEGVTIKLGKDIVMNEDDASTWGDAAPAYIWEPIGPGTTKYFAGTFDGQGHYISGLYSGARNNNGLFGFTYGATIKNLAVVNSYFSTDAYNGQFLGSVAARVLSGGTLKNVYSDAILESKQGDWFTGGIAGCIKDSKADNCVFTGKIFSNEGTGKTNKYIGGITGGPDSGGNSAKLTNCLFIGAIKSNDSGVGGIAGILGPGSLIDGCVSAGTIEGNAKQVGAVLGWVSGTGNHAITNCYYSAELGRNLYAGGDAGSVAETTGSKKLSAECKANSMVPTKWAKVYDSENRPTPAEIGAVSTEYVRDLNAIRIDIGGGNSVKFRINANLLMYGRVSNSESGVAVYGLAAYSNYRAPTVSMLSQGRDIVVSTGGNDNDGWYVRVNCNGAAGSVAILYLIGNTTPEFI